MQDVADAAGVSRALVSLVVRDAPHVTAEKRALVLAAIERLGYRRNRLASRLASRRTATIGLLVLDLRNSIYADIADGVSDVVEPQGSHVLIARGSADVDAQQAALESLLEMRVDGIAIAGYLGRTSTLQRTVGRTPTVVMTRRISADGIDSVASDDEEGAEAAVAHLIERGHTRIAHVSAPLSLPYPDRRAGYLTAMARHGFTPQLFEGDLVESGGRRAVEHWFGGDAPAPTAIFCFNDPTALGVMEALDQRGIAVPSEVAIVGYDDTTPAALLRVGLTSVDQDARSVGRQGAELLMNRIVDPSAQALTVVLRPTLRIRSSSGAG